MSSPLRCMIWHTEGTAVSGVFSWMYRLKKLFPFENIQVELVSMELQPFKFNQTCDTASIYDHCIKTPQEFIVFLKKNQDAIHIINHAFEYIEIAASLCKPLLERMKLIGVCHTDQDYYYANFQKTDAYLAGILAVSEICVKKLEQLFPKRRGTIPALPCWYVPLPPQRKIISQSDQPLRLIFNGRILQLQKRVFDLAVLVEQLSHLKAQVILSIAGDGPDLAELKNRIHPTADMRVDFLGAKTPWEMDSILSQSDIFIQTSEFEGASVSLMEAMAFQLVPVVTETASGTHLLKNKENALLCGIGDMKAMSQNIFYLSRNRAEIQRMADAARLTAEKHLSELNYPQKLANFLNGMAS